MWSCIACHVSVCPPALLFGTSLLHELPVPTVLKTAVCTSASRGTTKYPEDSKTQERKWKGAKACLGQAWLSVDYHALSGPVLVNIGGVIHVLYPYMLRNLYRQSGSFLLLVHSCELIGHSCVQTQDISGLFSKCTSTHCNSWVTLSLKACSFYEFTKSFWSRLYSCAGGGSCKDPSVPEEIPPLRLMNCAAYNLTSTSVYKSAPLS